MKIVIPAKIKRCGGSLHVPINSNIVNVLGIKDNEEVIIEAEAKECKLNDISLRVIFRRE